MEKQIVHPCQERVNQLRKQTAQRVVADGFPIPDCDPRVICCDNLKANPAPIRAPADLLGGTLCEP